MWREIGARSAGYKDYLSSMHWISGQQRAVYFDREIAFLCYCFVAVRGPSKMGER
jgi:hypothetical protein